MDISTLYQRSYVPYSGEPSVGISRSKEGHYFPGVRIENISYPLTISASQCALFNCLSEGYTPVELWVSNPNNTLATFWKEEWGITVKKLEENHLTDLHFTDVRLDTNTKVNETLVNLLDKAIVKESNFPVAALLETKTGIFSGVNIECSSWNMGLCAERIAIAKALAYGCEHLQTLHIHSRNGEFSSPCGACRQVLTEHMPNRQIHLHHADHSTSFHFSNDLLPHSFRSSSLANK